MPPVGNEWLALTQEPSLEPDIPICDPHHHFWDFRTWRGPYQRYLLHEFIEDINCGHNIVSSVFVEAGAMYRVDGREEMQPVGEVEFVQGLAAASASGLYGKTRAAASIVGNANLSLGETVEEVLDRLIDASPNRFRGIRHSVTWDPHPEIEVPEGGIQGLLADSQFRKGARVLASKGLSFDAFLYHPQLPELADFANAIPDLNIVLNHMGALHRIGPYANNDEEVLQNWRQGISEVAKCPNITVKLGGVGKPRSGYEWHHREKPIGSEELAASLGPLMNYCIEQFGPDRSMFESNFPEDKISYSYNILYNAFKLLSKNYSRSERASLFHDTAARVYRVET